MQHREALAQAKLADEHRKIAEEIRAMEAAQRLIINNAIRQAETARKQAEMARVEAQEQRTAAEEQLRKLQSR